MNAVTNDLSAVTVKPWSAGRVYARKATGDRSLRNFNPL